MHYVGHWEKLQINTVSGKENWWQYVQSSTDSSKIPLRRRYPPDCVKCGQAVLVEDDVFSRYGVEWQPLCLKCYATGSSVSLLSVTKEDKKEAEKSYCHWCHEVDGIKDNFCERCLDYVDRVQRDFGLNKNEAYTNLYHFTSSLRKQRKIEPSK